MLKEVIQFVEKTSERKAGQIPQKPIQDLEKKFIIIKTKEKNNILTYDGISVLDNESIITKWLDENKHYKKIIENINHYVLPSALNKALGSTSGLATYSFFVFKLSNANLKKLKQKIDKTKFSYKQHNDAINIQNVHKILNDAIYDLTQKTSDNYEYLDFYAIIHTDEKRFQMWKKITDEFIKTRMSYGKATLRMDGECFVCKQKGSMSPPIFLTTYDQAKIFLNHKTRSGIDDQGVSLYACEQCIKKSNEFDSILNKYKIKIFPLFVERNEIQEEIKWLEHNPQENTNKFAFIFNQLKQREEKNIFDFYLVVKRNEYFFFDYITGYRWEIGKYTDFFDKNKSESITRQGIENKIAKVLSGSQHIDYFGDIKNKDNQQATMIYSFRHKLFDFVYRNQNTLTITDLRKIILFRIEKEIRNNSVNPQRCKETLNLFFNKNLLLQTKNQEEILLNKIKTAKDVLLSNDIENFKIHDDDEWAYFTGQLAYYLISLSKSKNKNYGLLEPFINKSTTHLVKKTIEQLIERYEHEISINNRRFRTIAANIFSYPIDRPFMELKIPFYVGTFDDNVIYSKKEVKGDDA